MVPFNGDGGWRVGVRARACVKKKGGGVLGDVEVEGAAHRPLPFPAPALDQQATDCHSLHLLHTHARARAQRHTHGRAALCPDSFLLDPATIAAFCPAGAPAVAEYIV